MLSSCPILGLGLAQQVDQFTGIRSGATSADAIALICFHRKERPVGLFSLDGHPHLKSVVIEAPDLSAYRALTEKGA